MDETWTPANLAHMREFLETIGAFRRPQIGDLPTDPCPFKNGYLYRYFSLIIAARPGNFDEMTYDGAHPLTSSSVRGYGAEIVNTRILG